MNRIRGLDLAVNAGMVYKNLVHSGIHRSLDIYFNTIPDHNAFSRPGVCFIKSIFEDLLVWLNAVTAFRGYDLYEIAGDTRIFKLTVLGILKAIGDQVKFIPLVGEIVKALDGVWKQ